MSTLPFFSFCRQTIEHSLYLWSRASGEALLFDEAAATDTSADLDIYFALYNHNDFEDFDGPGGIVAHSTYPMDGRVHLDASEQWTLDGVGGRGLDLRYVLAHELGHAIGLRHSNASEAVMNPIYRKSGVDGVRLGQDDVSGVRRLYERFVMRRRRRR